MLFHFVASKLQIVPINPMELNANFCSNNSSFQIDRQTDKQTTTTTTTDQIANRLFSFTQEVKVYERKTRSMMLVAAYVVVVWR